MAFKASVEEDQILATEMRFAVYTALQAGIYFCHLISVFYNFSISSEFLLFEVTNSSNYRRLV